MTTFVRTVLGDIDAAALGITYAHEHLVIHGGRPVQLEPDFDLSDVDAMATEVGAAMDLGLGGVVDAMPCDCGSRLPTRRPRSRDIMPLWPTLGCRGTLTLTLIHGKRQAAVCAQYPTPLPFPSSGVMDDRAAASTPGNDRTSGSSRSHSAVRFSASG